MIITESSQLRGKSIEVLPEEVDDLRTQLETELQLSSDNGLPGIGLAAPQIGILKRMAIIRLGNDMNIDLVNAKIVNQYDIYEFNGEGCLSFPGQYESTMRFNEIQVENMIEPKSFVARGLLAVAIAHELDHLDGKILPDFAIKKKTKIRPNDPCHCGAKDSVGNVKKYKKCHGA